MKYPKIPLCFVLACCLLLAACGNDNAGRTGLGPAQAGRFVEQDITPPAEYGHSSFTMQDDAGNLVCYSDDLTWRRTSRDGGQTFEEAEGPGGGIGVRIAGIEDVVLLDGGDLLACVVTRESVADGTYAKDMLYISADGATHFVEFEGLSPMGFYFCIVPLPEGRVYIYHYYSGDMETGQANDIKQTNAIFDVETGKLLQDISELGMYTTNLGAAGEDRLYLINYDGTTLSFAADGSPLAESVAFPGWESGYRDAALAVDPAGVLHYISRKGIYAANAEGGSDMVLNSAGLAFGDPGASPAGLFALGDGVFVVRMQTTEGYRLYRYVWDENAVVDEDKSITVWALRDSNTLRVAIGRYLQQYPEGQVSLEIALAGGGGLRAEDAIRNLNTELLAGKGPDVIMLDGTPLESYIDKGALADLRGLVDTGTYYESLLEQVDGEDGMYCIPARVAIPVLGANGEYLTDDIGEYIDMMKQCPPGNAEFGAASSYKTVEERSLVAYQNLDEIWEQMWAANAPAIISGTELDTGNLRLLLQNIKEIAQYNGYSDLPADAYTIGMSITLGSGMGEPSHVDGSLLPHIVGSTHTSMFIADDILVLNYLGDQSGYNNMSVEAERGFPAKGAAYGLQPALEGGVWLPSLLAGMNANSEKQKEAGEFISILLSDNVQSGRNGDGFAVTRSGMQLQIDTLNAVIQFDSGGIKIEDFDALFAQLTVMNLVDDVLKEKVYGYAIPYVQGKISLEDAIAGIERDSKNYLAERQ